MRRVKPRERERACTSGFQQQLRGDSFRIVDREEVTAGKDCNPRIECVGERSAHGFERKIPIAGSPDDVDGYGGRAPAGPGGGRPPPGAAPRGGGGAPP